ncbi:MAG: hypothetical protein Q9184_006422 [Pyrenodesmia sp. 2 TL-2023]
MEHLDPNTPAAPPPPGVVPNFNGPSRAGAMITTCVAITAMMVIFVSLRLYSRARYAKRFGPDDLSIPSAPYNYLNSDLHFQMVSIAFTVVTIFNTEAGYGRHLWDYPVRTFNKSFFQKVNAVQALYSPLILLTKISLFLLYYRVFSLDRRTRLLIHFGIGINAIFYAICFALFLYRGRSLAQTFASHHSAVDPRNLGTAQASFNIASDIYLLCLPLPVVSKLQLPRKKKIGVMAIFMTGAVICSILNLYYRVLNGRTLDVSWAVPPAYITSVVEINVGIMCGCFPALPPILRHLRLRADHINASDSWIFKWLRLRTDTSEKKLERSGNMRLTLGSQIKGKGHFFTMKSLFSNRETHDTTSVDLILENSRPPGQAPHGQADIEPGLLVGSDGVASVRERMEQ